MFTGIIEAIGVLEEIESTASGKRLRIGSNLRTQEMRTGESIALNGCCLTVEEISQNAFSVFLSHETLARTNLGQFAKGAKVNLERALVYGARMDGHMVQGHVEGLGVLKAKVKKGESLEVTIELPSLFQPLVIPKGSIAVDGISLTINALIDMPNHFIQIFINLIPHTLEQTTLGAKDEGETLHIETDPIGRYVQRYLEIQDRAPQSRSGLGKDA